MVVFSFANVSFSVDLGINLAELSPRIGPAITMLWDAYHRLLLNDPFGGWMSLTCISYLLGKCADAMVREYRRLRAPRRYAPIRDMAGQPHTELWRPAKTVKGAQLYRVHHVKIGGLGVVYFVTAEDGSALTLKTLRPDLSANTRLRRVFVSEARILCDLPDHPAVLRAIRTEMMEGSFFVVTPWIGYPSYDTSVASLVSNKTLSLPFALDIAMSCATAISASREIIPGLVHRDIKPGNILIKGKQPVLADFGLAKVADEAFAQLTQAASSRPTNTLSRVDGSVGVGTLPYMAPEQCTGAPVGEHTDVYAIGAVLYEMLTGRWLFDVLTAREFVECVVSRSPMPPSMKRTGLPRTADDVVMKCLEKRPEKRFANMEQLWDALGEVYNGLTGTPLFKRLFIFSTGDEIPFFNSRRTEWGADRN